MPHGLHYLFRISQKLDNMDYAGAAPEYRLGPVEVVIDVPFYVGCFIELSDPSSKGLSITDVPDSNTPAWCITQCATNDPSKRYACKLLDFYLNDSKTNSWQNVFPSVLKNGNQCSCFEELPVDEVFFVNDVDESDTCNMTCPGSDLYKCGGGSSYSIYIASMQFFL